MEVAGFHGVIRSMLEADRDGAHENGQHLSGGGERDGKGDTGAHFLFAGDDEDGGDDGGQRGVWGECGADIHPAECHHFQGTADDDAGGHVAEDEAGQRTGDKRAVCLEFVKDGAHAGQAADEKDQDDLQG